MKKHLVIFAILLTSNLVFANPLKITPAEKISTSTKEFQLGNTYNFKVVGSDKIVKGTVVYYRPNGIMGQEAQIEISNFRDENNRYLSGEITIIPDNHKTFQEFMNVFETAEFALVRGSEIALLPDKHFFIINDTNKTTKIITIPIKPIQPISTTHNELEIDDKIQFATVVDIYKDGKIFLKSGTTIYGVIDYIDENGWGGDNAIIHFKKFITKSVNGEKITLYSDLQINGFDIIKFKSKRFKQFFNYIGVIFRGKEIDIKPYDEDIRFNLIVK